MIGYFYEYIYLYELIKLQNKSVSIRAVSTENFLRDLARKFLIHAYLMAKHPSNYY